MMPGRLVVAMLVLFVAACASSPTTVYLTLEAPSISATAQADQRAIVVGPISVPEAVDRPQLMLSVGANRLQAAANMRWAQPYKLELARALAANLATALSNPRVVPASAAVPMDSYRRVVMDVLTVDLRDGETVSLEILWAVRESASGKLLVSARSVLRETVTGVGGEAIAAAHSRVIARLAAEIAPTLK